MKTAIHPNYFKDITISCACGHTVTAGSTKKELKTELCSNCHPFYTGKQRLVDTAGRVEKFRARQQATADKKATNATKKSKKAKDTDEDATVAE